MDPRRMVLPQMGSILKPPMMLKPVTKEKKRANRAATK